jgi:hypothetical protein
VVDWRPFVRRHRLLRVHESGEPARINRLDATTTTGRELYDTMLEIYPNRVNPGSLWGAANITKKQA